jgi:predicted permease
MNDLYLRLRALFLRNRVERELNEELEFHVEMQAHKNHAAGMSQAEARRQARIQFGVGDAVKEECRDARRVNLIETMIYDIRYALRGFRRTPLFTLTVVATIALGLGWNTAVFTIFNACVLRPVAVHDPYSLYQFWWIDRMGASPLTWSQFQELQEEHPALTDVAAFHGLFARMDGRFARGMLVDGEYFPMLAVNAIRGRAILPEDTRAPGSQPVAVLSYRIWQERFGHVPDILGRKVMISGHPFDVVGVMPDGFTGLGKALPDFWAPITMSSQIEEGPDLFTSSRPADLGFVGRLKPGESLQQAQAALTAWATRIGQKDVRAIFRSEATVLPLEPRYIFAFLPIGIVFLLVLISACANVGNMMLARGMARQREIGIRLSLGAARARLVRQLLTESVLLALPAAVAGFAVSETVIKIGMRVIFAAIPPDLVDHVPLVSLAPDARVFVFTFGAAIVAALLFGLAPAIQATRLNVMQAAHGDFSSDFRPSRLRNALLIAQVTVSALLLICSFVFLRGAHRLGNLDTGMRTRDVVEIGVREKSRALAISKIPAEPGVESMAATSDSPLDSTLPVIAASGAYSAYKYVSPEYFPVFDIPLRRGRNFTAEEARSGAPVAILSEVAAKRLWPNRDALGESLRLTPDPDPPRGGRPQRYQTVRVVGIARDTAVGGIANPDRSCLYFPTSLEAPGNVLLARVQGDPEAARQKLNSALEDVDPGAVEYINKMQDVVAGGIFPFRAAYWVSAAVGGVALLLTLSGIYGVLSYVVAQRTKEIGIRIAMGAGTAGVTRLVLSQCMRLAARGIGLGVVLALGASKLASAQVVIDPFDQLAYVGGVALVLAACVCAAYIPARRAARVDPITTLRYD